MATSAVRRTRSNLLTERAIRALKSGEKRADGALPPGHGRLIIRAKARGADDQIVRDFFFRYVDQAGKDRMLLIGRHGAGGAQGGVTLEQARARARDLRELVRTGIDPILQSEETAAANAQRQRDAQRQRERDAQQGTLLDLCQAYVADLRAHGKASARDTERTLQVHVLEPFPVLAARRAAEITPGDISDIMARMISKEIKRRTNIVRSMLAAAFVYGMNADNDPKRKAQALKAGEDVAHLVASKRYGIQSNPVAAVPRYAEFDRVGDRVLNDAELRHYLQAVQEMQTPIGALLRCAVWLGGQRPAQLKRVTWADYDSAAGLLELIDGKGRRKAGSAPRRHLLPVSERIATDIENQRMPSAVSGFIFSTTKGTKEIDASTLSNAVAAISEQATGKGLQDIGSDGQPLAPYTMRDIRRTVETRMAGSSGLKISRETRAQLLSHGRASGVQAKHYDRYEYLEEKRAALTKWEAYLDRLLSGAEGQATVIHARFGASGPE